MKRAPTQKETEDYFVIMGELNKLVLAGRLSSKSALKVLAALDKEHRREEVQA